jgi:hypothetical protein
MTLLCAVCLVFAEHAGIKENVVRYISHEIRTPLNTVFMGIPVKHLGCKEQTARRGGVVEDSGGCSGRHSSIYDKIVDGRMKLDQTDFTAFRLEFRCVYYMSEINSVL